MRLTRLYLRNFRVYEDAVDLEMPPGLVGIFGRNGAGKSTLLESITWTLWGRARTAKDQIRTSGINADCVTEVEFEHEGHLYLVRRTITGVNHTVKAEAHADGSQVAEGVRDVARYVHSVLGMDDVAFRASVFAEQKQLAAFSSHAPAERRKLVMQLLGITPLDGAREQSRRDAKAAAERLQDVRRLLPDRGAIEKELADAQVQATAAGALAAAAETDAQARGELAKTAAKALEDLTNLSHEYDNLVKDGQRVRKQRDETEARLNRWISELAALDAAAVRLEAIRTEAEGVEELETLLGLVRAVVAAEAELDAIPVPSAPADPETLTAALEPIVEEAQRLTCELAEAGGRLAASRSALDQAREVAGRADGLTQEADCPLCGQALGEAFEQVQSHRREEVVNSEAIVTELAGSVATLTSASREVQAIVDLRRRQLKEAQSAWSDYQRRCDRRSAAEATRDKALSSLGRVPLDGEVVSLAEAVTKAKTARQERDELTGALKARSRLEADRDTDSDGLTSLESDLTILRDKVKALAFKPDALTAAREAAAKATEVSERAASEHLRLSTLATASAAAVDGHRRRLEDADCQHESLAELGEDARHLGRVADLMNVFRNTVVASVGPTLSAQAAELFGELTDREYDRLEVDPDTYEIQIRDGGIAYGMDRYSGSETDLANLALRVAISEHVRFQSGGTVGLLVLDEVFGPLDDDRKERMLNALERLKGRFRQVLVVTHATEIKEQLPSAVEVIKLPGRRATARVLNV